MATNLLSQRQIEAFARDGVILVRNAVDTAWQQRLTEFADLQLDRPSQWANDGASDDTTGRMFTDRYLWQDSELINDYVFHSPCAQLAAEATQSESVRFYFDHLLVKEPATESITPWHQDIPYWPFLGKQVCSVWVALTPATIAGSAMEFVRGSHLDDKYYQAKMFAARDDHPNSSWTGKSQAEPVPDIEANRDAYDIVGWDVEPGDAVVFSSWILHWAGGNASSSQRRIAISTRWLGDDAVWHPHEGADPTVNPNDVRIEAGQSPADDQYFPVVYPAT